MMVLIKVRKEDKTSWTKDRHVRQICDIMNINCGNAKPQDRDVRLHVKVKVRFICITHLKQQS